MSIADKLTYLNETKQLIKESINLTGANITNEPFRDYAHILEKKLPELIGDPSPIWNSYEPIGGTGTSFSINAYNSVFEYDIVGNTVQDGTPTPDAPIPVNVVSGDNEIVINGKNKFNINDVQVGKAWNNTDNTARSVIIIPVEQNVEYIISMNGTNTMEGIYVSYSSKTLEENVINGVGLSQITSFPRTYTSSTKYIIIQFNKTSITLNDVINLKLQVEKGSTATTYEAYKGGIYPINLGDIELCKIGTYQDYIYIRNGKWYLHKEIGKAILDGTESWTLSGNTPNNNYILNDLYTNIATVSNDITVGNIKSNYLEAITYAQGYNYNTFNGIAVGISRSQFRISLTTDIVNRNVNNFKTWLSTHNIITYYQLDTPTDTEITDANLILQLISVRLVNGLNNIITVGSDLNPILNVEAIKYLD